MPAGKPLAPGEALELVLANARRLPAERLGLRAALGRTLAEDVTSHDDVPSFDNSAMDGFAVRAADTRGASGGEPATLAVGGESRAGVPAAVPLEAGRAIRISTGAMLPAGADAVVRIEDCEDRGATVDVHVEVSPGAEIRRAGEDIRAGERVLEAAALVGPAELGVLASVGASEVTCARRPRVVVLATGDELTEPGTPLGPGQIRNSNAYTVPAQAARAGAEIAAVELVPDDLVATVDALSRALEQDVVIVCGGVSVGPHDHVKAALAQLEVEEVFWGVALRPGRPTWFGTRGSTLVFGLPGNPVSAMVTFHLFVRPALAAMTGTRLPRRRAIAAMDERYRKRPGRMHAVRCRLEIRSDGWHVSPTKDQGSHVLTSMLGADALALVEVDRGDVEPGEKVEFELLKGSDSS